MFGKRFDDRVVPQCRWFVLGAAFFFRFSRGRFYDELDRSAEDVGRDLLHGLFGVDQRLREMRVIEDEDDAVAVLAHALRASKVAGKKRPRFLEALHKVVDVAV